MAFSNTYEDYIRFCANVTTVKELVVRHMRNPHLTRGKIRGHCNM